MADLPTTKPNPNPSRITGASWWFMDQLLKLEPDTENSGIYGNKPGYHGTRAENQARDRTDGDVNYSVKLPLDLIGPPDRGAGYDWTFHTAQRGDYSRMAVYGARLLAAFNARDPRLYGWREALGQTDRDQAAEGLDFQGWFKRVPDSSHEWHFHFSELRAYVESYVNKQAFLSVLSGETLADYLARGGQLIGADMGWADGDIKALKNRVDAIIDMDDINPFGDSLKPEPNELARAIRAIAADVKAVDGKVAALATPTVTDEQLDALAVKLAARLGTPPTRADVEAAAEAAVRRVLGAVDGATPPV